MDFFVDIIDEKMVLVPTDGIIIMTLYFYFYFLAKKVKGLLKGHHFKNAAKIIECAPTTLKFYREIKSIDK